MSMGPIGIYDLIVYMQEHGSSLLINWGEDNGLWEVSWITSGIRFTGVGSFLDVALSECKDQADLAKRDMIVYGKSFVKDGKRIDPMEVVRPFVNVFCQKHGEQEADFYGRCPLCESIKVKGIGGDGERKHAKDIWWCCTADYPEHDDTCFNKRFRCCNPECGKIWHRKDLVYPKHSPEDLLCPDCREVVEAISEDS